MPSPPEKDPGNAPSGRPPERKKGASDLAPTLLVVGVVRISSPPVEASWQLPQPLRAADPIRLRLQRVYHLRQFLSCLDPDGGLTLRKFSIGLNPLRMKNAAVVDGVRPCRERGTTGLNKGIPIIFIPGVSSHVPYGLYQRPHGLRGPGCGDADRQRPLYQHIPHMTTTCFLASSACVHASS